MTLLEKENCIGSYVTDNNKLSTNEIIIELKKGGNYDEITRRIIDNYRKYPMYIIKYITLIYPKETAINTIKYITNNRKSHELIDCILDSYTIKICDIPEMKNMTCNGNKKCICYHRICWKYIYNEFIKLMNSNVKLFLTNNEVYQSFTTLILKTDVLDDELYKIFKKISYNPKLWNLIIKIIKDTELYGSDYGDIIFMIRDLIILNDRMDESKRNIHINEFQNRQMLITVLKRYNDMQMTMSKITDNIYISDMNGAKNVSLLRSKKIQNIVSITKRPIFMIDGIEYDKIMIDDTDSIDFINATHKTVDKILGLVNKNRIILVHCFKGLSRSVCFVIFLLIKNGMTFKQAYEFVKQKRNIDPNPIFIKQLIDYSNTNHIPNGKNDK